MSLLRVHLHGRPLLGCPLLGPDPPRAHARRAARDTARRPRGALRQRHLPPPQRRVRGLHHLLDRAPLPLPRTGQPRPGGAPAATTAACAPRSGLRAGGRRPRPCFRRRWPCCRRRRPCCRRRRPCCRRRRPAAAGLGGGHGGPARGVAAPVLPGPPAEVAAQLVRPVQPRGGDGGGGGRVQGERLLGRLPRHLERSLRLLPLALLSRAPPLALADALLQGLPVAHPPLVVGGKFVRVYPASLGLMGGGGARLARG